MKLAETFSQVLVHWFVRVAFIGKILNENVINNPLIDFAIYYFQIPKNGTLLNKCISRCTMTSSCAGAAPHSPTKAADPNLACLMSVQFAPGSLRPILLKDISYLTSSVRTLEYALVAADST